MEQTISLPKNAIENTLKENFLFDKKLSIKLPKSFLDMPEEIIKSKYSSEERPQIIKCSNGGKETFSLNYFNAPVQENEISKILNGFQVLITKTYSDTVFYDKKLEKTGAGWFDFKGYVSDCEQYNLMLVSAIGGGTLLGVFTCPFEEASEWKPLIHQIILSIQDLSK